MAKKANKERPGIMFYFDMISSLEEFDDAEVGKTFRALLIYGMTGKEPSFEDRGLRTLWKELKRKADWDGEKYKATCKGRQYAVYCREVQKKGIEPLTMEEWEKNQMVSNDDFDIQLQHTTLAPAVTPEITPSIAITPTLATTSSLKTTETSNPVSKGGVGGEQSGNQVVYQYGLQPTLPKDAEPLFQEYQELRKEKTSMENVKRMVNLKLFLRNTYDIDVEKLMNTRGEYDSA